MQDRLKLRYLLRPLRGHNVSVRNQHKRKVAAKGVL